MYYRGDIPAYLVEDGPGSVEECQRSEWRDDDYDDESDDSHNSEVEAYKEAMKWAQDKEAEAIAQERKSKADFQAGRSTPVGLLKGRWYLSSENFYSGDRRFDTLFFGEPSDSNLEDYEE